MRNHGTYIRAMDKLTNKEAAHLCGCAESTLSEWTGEHMGRAMQVLSAVGLKVVPREEKTLPAAEIAAYKLLARKAMDIDIPESAWGDNL